MRRFIILLVAVACALCAPTVYAQDWGQDCTETVTETGSTTMCDNGFQAEGGGTADTDASTDTGWQPTVHPFVSFNQGDWGSDIASRGCGPTALAMVVSTLTGRHVTPVRMTRLVKRYWPSGMASHGMVVAALKYGLRLHFWGRNLVPAASVIEAGGKAIVLVHKGYFTGRGHYMVLRGYWNNYFRLADPNGLGRHGDSESHWWSKAFLHSASANLIGVWTFESGSG